MGTRQSKRLRTRSSKRAVLEPAEMYANYRSQRNELPDEPADEEEAGGGFRAESALTMRLVNRRQEAGRLLHNFNNQQRRPRWRLNSSMGRPSDESPIEEEEEEEEEEEYHLPGETNRSPNLMDSSLDIRYSSELNLAGQEKSQNKLKTKTVKKEREDISNNLLAVGRSGELTAAGNATKASKKAATLLSAKSCNLNYCDCCDFDGGAIIEPQYTNCRQLLKLELEQQKRSQERHRQPRRWRLNENETFNKRRQQMLHCGSSQPGHLEAPELQAELVYECERRRRRQASLALRELEWARSRRHNHHEKRRLLLLEQQQQQQRQPSSTAGAWIEGGGGGGGGPTATMTLYDAESPDTLARQLARHAGSDASLGLGLGELASCELGGQPTQAHAKLSKSSPDQREGRQKLQKLHLNFQYQQQQTQQENKSKLTLNQTRQHSPQLFHTPALQVQEEEEEEDPYFAFTSSNAVKVHDNLSKFQQPPRLFGARTNHRSAIPFKQHLGFKSTFKPTLYSSSLSSTSSSSLLSSVATTAALISPNRLEKQTNFSTNFATIQRKMSTMVVTSAPSSHLQQGLAYPEQERQRLGLLGLLPAAVQDQELQVKAVMNFLDNCTDDLSKYFYLRQLKDFNEHLFYHSLTTNVEKLMPLVYTPTVGLGCQKFSQIYLRPRGLFVTINDIGRVANILANWPERDVRVIVVTDGERILGLGDLGANGMGISIGKLSLYTALAGIPPKNVLPVTIDVGTNNEQFLQDPFYIGLRQKRTRGQKYDQLIEEFMKAVVERWGRSCLIQFEDFANATAFNLLQRYRDSYCTFNDDIQGTASVCLAGLIGSAKLIGKRLGDCSFLFYGAGEANLGTANLLVMAMREEGVQEKEAVSKIWLVDSKGLVVKSRTDLSSHKRQFAQEAPQIEQLEQIIDYTRPVAIVGASAQGGAFNESICKKMAQFNERPIIFALSNPTSKAECTAKEAYEWTKAKCVFASGSPFEPVQYEGKTYITGQGNNAYIFPGVGLAAIAAHAHIIPEEVFLVAAKALSNLVTQEEYQIGLVYPRLNKIRDVTLQVAAKVLQYLYTERLANFRPEPSDKIGFLKELQYDTRYTKSQ